MTKERGKFVVFEGNDGVGKSTMAGRLAEYLKERGMNVVLTKEPGGIPETVPIRKLIFDERVAEDGVAQILLFAADRRAHLLLQVLPVIKKGGLVVSDRYYGSTRVYQGERGVNKEDVLWAENLAIALDGERVEPDITILLDIDPGVGMARKQSQGGQNYFDEDRIERQERRRQAYLELARELGWEVIDASLPEGEVFEKILIVLRKKGILPEKQ